MPYAAQYMDAEDTKEPAPTSVRLEPLIAEFYRFLAYRTHRKQGPIVRGVLTDWARGHEMWDLFMSEEAPKLGLTDPDAVAPAKKPKRK
jgi:hypothetical protein